MTTPKKSGTQTTTVHCPSCGEDYAVSYKKCPFCDWAPQEKKTSSTKGGTTSRPLSSRPTKRPNRKRRGGGYTAGLSPVTMAMIAGSVVLIIAAIIIVVNVVKPLVDNGQTTLPDPTPTPTATATPTPTPEPTSDIPAEQTATSFTLNYSDVSMSETYPEPITLKATFAPTGSTGFITWESADPSIAAVDEDGVVRHGTVTGSTTITATMAGGYSQTCIIRSSVTSSAYGASTVTAPSTSTSDSDTTGSSTSTTTTTTTTTTSLTLNREDFTLTKLGETFAMSVGGTLSTPTWSIGNSSIATIDANGQVTAVSTGMTTITCTIDGTTLECIVRCSW